MSSNGEQDLASARALVSELRAEGVRFIPHATSWGYVGQPTAEQQDRMITMREQIQALLALEPEAPTHDEVERPAHYTMGAIEVIDAIESWGMGYHLGNVIKYVARAGRKGDALTDLRKARWYLTREIERMERGAKD